MRGVYTATYLASVADGFARQCGSGALDVGRAFDLIVGTSVGGIIACALAADLPLPAVVELFRTEGQHIFPRKLPAGIGFSLFVDLLRRPRANHKGNEALRHALDQRFGSTTLAEVYNRRGIALAITAVELGQHRSWVFKTPHWPGSNHRDDHYRLVDVCLATSAAPVYRSLAALNHPDAPSGHFVFADGGLWANNPVLVGLIEALNIAAPEQEIQVFCLGTCPRPAGEQVQKADVHRGLVQWKFGGLVAPLAIDSQEFAFDHMARMLSRHIKRPCEIVRFPSERVPAAIMSHLDLDETRAGAIDALINQARSDASMAHSRCQDLKDRDGQFIKALFADAQSRGTTSIPSTPHGAGVTEGTTQAGSTSQTKEN